MQSYATLPYCRIVFLGRRVRCFLAGEASSNAGPPASEALEPRRLFSGGYVYEQLASFGSSVSTSTPGGQIVMDKGGNLYGFTSVGGSNGTGVAYEVQQGNTTPITLASFSAASAGAPFAVTGPVIVSSGVLFGVSTTGGVAIQDGTVFEIV